MAPPISKPKRPLQPLKVLEGAAALQQIANHLKDTLDGSAKSNETYLKILRSKVVSLEFIARLTAHTVDDLVWIIEKQQMENEALRSILKALHKE